MCTSPGTKLHTDQWMSKMANKGAAESRVATSSQASQASQLEPSHGQVI
jgi:hypothetical protein